MNYSIIQLAQDQLIKYENDYQELVKKINISLFALAKTNFDSEKKRKLWNGLLEHTNNIIRKAEEILDKVSAISFSGSEIVLYEEKEHLIEKYRAMLRKLGKEKEEILRQIKKKATFVTPLRKKDVKKDYCYFCDVSIATSFPYKLKFEEQKILEIEVAGGAAFCSQECLLGYCREYKNREKLRQEEEKKIKERIENDRKKLTEIQERITELTEKINSLERKERELELVPENNPVEKEEDGFFRRLGQKIGLVKKPSPLSKIERVRKIKEQVRVELEKTGEEFQKCLIILSLDEQKEQERKKIEERVLMEKERIAAKGEEGENYD